ncbi:MAG: hypothetical protein APR62_10820 [Smithella sp. SDB]|nr:MAG: hypothetical protein APR62_10820 [Smithella sp. SDB]
MKKSLLFSIILILFAVLAYGAEPQKVNFNIDKAKLESGTLQVFEENYVVEGKGQKKRAVGVILINAPPEKVWNVLENWDVMGEFVPGLSYYKTVHVIKPIGKDDIGETLIEGKLSFPPIRYTLDVTFDKANLRQDWRMVTEKEIASYNAKQEVLENNSSMIKSIEGYEYLEPYNNGSQTVYTYAPIIETFGAVPDFIDRALTKNTLSGYVKSVKKRVESGK